MTAGKLFVVSAPSGAGKTSLVNALVAATPALLVSISHTTRKARKGEVDGVNYHFVSETDFRAMIAGNLLLEHALVFGNHYGTSRAWVAEQLLGGQDVILEIDWQGARQIRAAHPGTISIFILPPSREELKLRLTRRGQDDDATIDARMAEALEEFSHYPEFDYLVVNDHFERAVGDLAAIVRCARLEREVQQRRLDDMLRRLMA